MLPTFAAAAELPIKPLLRVGQDSTPAVLVGVMDDGRGEFRIDDQIVEVAPEELLRWSSPRDNQTAAQIILADGSRVMLAEAWLGSPVLEVTKEIVRANTKASGEIELPRKLMTAAADQSAHKFLAITASMD